MQFFSNLCGPRMVRLMESAKWRELPVWLPTSLQWWLCYSRTTSRICDFFPIRRSVASVLLMETAHLVPMMCYCIPWSTFTSNAARVHAHFLQLACAASCSEVHLEVHIEASGRLSRSSSWRVLKPLVFFFLCRASTVHWTKYLSTSFVIVMISLYALLAGLDFNIPVHI